MSDQQAPAGQGRRPLEPAAADALRAYTAQTRVWANQFAAVLEDIDPSGLPDPEQCTPWEVLRAQHLVRLAKQRLVVA